MTQFDPSDRDVDRAIRSWLHEDRHEDASRVAGAVLDRVDTVSQRRATWWPTRRTPVMTKFLTIGLGAAAVVSVLVVGSTLLGFPGPRLGGAPTESDAPPTSGPSMSASPGLPVGPHIMVSTLGENEDRIAVAIPAQGWSAEPDQASLTKDLGGDDRVTVVAVPGDHYQVPRDPCHWQTGSEGEPGHRFAETVEEFVLYLTEQTHDTPEGSITPEFSTPVDITMGGHPGQSITGAVPASSAAGCDERRFCNLTDRDGGSCLLPRADAGARLALWISAPPGRNPAFWVVAATYAPRTEAALLAEMNAIVDSMTISEE